MPEKNNNDDILFEQLNRNRKKRRRRILITVITIVTLVLIAIAAAVSILSARVQRRFANSAADVKSYAASIGRVSTTVSGTGVLSSVDSEQVTVPEGVEIDKVLISAGDTLKEGDAIASVKAASVMSALSSTQEALDALNKQLNTAKNDAVKNYIPAGISGRVKLLYAQPEQTVVDCMTEHGALAVLSLDGCMVVEIEAQLEPQAKVTVVTSDEKEYPGTVKNSGAGRSTVTLTDDGPVFGDTVTVLDAEGSTLGTGTLEIHNPLAVTGYAGTVRRVNVSENQKVYSGTTLFSLTDTGYSANYDALLQTRTETEETMNTLIGLLRTGNVCAPFDGTVLSVDYGAAEDSALSAYAAYTGSAASSASAAGSVVTMAPDEQVNVSISIDETDILSLKIGQNADITVSSVGDDVFHGSVTDVSKVGTSVSGVTGYSAVITLDKTADMLTGMTASVDIQIEGVEDAVIIPVDALHQTSNRFYVFTAYDAETQQYGGITDVVPGVSGSNYVEIISGLNPGDTVYYTEKNSFNFFSMMTGMGNRGGMPSGNRGGSSRPGMGG